MKEGISLTEYFFDTDCLCAFLWVQRQDILVQLYSKQLVIPEPVYQELCRPQIQHLKTRADLLIKQNHGRKQSLQINSPAFSLYMMLTRKPEHGWPIIGNGEAAAIALAKEEKGIVASNNLRDISAPVAFYQLNLVTTGDILEKAFSQNFITETEGNQIWQAMLMKRRRLGAKSFTDYLKRRENHA